jgi:iron-sulfur cluster assembly protein
MITVTERAAKQIQLAAKNGGMEGMALRIAATRKPDGAIDYAMGFDEIRDTDVRIPAHEIDLVVDPEYTDLLDGCVLDYVELEPRGAQFIFMNPNDPHHIPPKKE